MEKVRLGECATFINGYAFKPTDWSGNGIPIIRIQNLTGSMKQLNYYNGKLDSKYIINNGDILISWSASLGIFEWKKGKAYLNQHIFKVEFNKKDINKKYFVYLIKSKINEMKKNTHGSTMKHITKSDFNKIEIFLPNIQKQQEISNKLDKVQEIIDLRKKQIEELDKLIKSQFVEMFKNSEKVNLFEISNIIMGQSPDSSSYNDEMDGIPFFQGKADYGDKYTIVRHWTNKPSKLAYKGDVLMSVRAPVGPVNISSVNCCIGRGLCAISAKMDITNNEFIYNSLNAMQNEISTLGFGSTFKAITKNDVYNLKVPKASIELQNQFAEFVKLIDEQKSIIEKSLKETEELQASLMNKYFG